MCDTMVIMPNYTKNGSLIFAKNADRSPNEPLLTVRYPAKTYALTTQPKVKLTYITIPQAEHTYEVVLMKPSWIWGAEMGFNEFGLNIGNEAVFTKEKKGEDSLIGMDMVRLALERTADAKSALNYMISLLAEYGQGGNCGYDKNFHYHNAFLIADKNNAYVLETAGAYYVAKEVKDFYAISNCLSIQDDYDKIHKQAISRATHKKWAKLDREFRFRDSFSDKLFTHFAGADKRRQRAIDIISADKGVATIETALKVMRSHHPNKKENRHSVQSICMHAGGLIGDHTTGSYVAELSKDSFEYYISASSLPCLSVYMPFVMSEQTVVPSQDDRVALDRWLKAEKLIRYILSGQIDREKYLKDRNQIEKMYINAFSKATSLTEKEKIVKDSWSAVDLFITDYIDSIKGVNHNFRLGSLPYRKYWTQKTKKLLEKDN